LRFWWDFCSLALSNL